MGPTATDVARRLAALRVVCLYALQAPSRSKLAELARGWSASDKHAFEQRANTERDAYWKKVKAIGLWGELTPRERAFAGTTVATMTSQQQLDAAWLTEAIAVLSWALAARDTLPSYDGPVDHDVVHAHLSEHATLRPEAELERERAKAELWHWRAHQRELAERGTPFSPSPPMRSAGVTTRDDLVRHTAKVGHDKGYLPAPVDGDFPVNGKAYRALSAGAFAAVRTLSVERHRALNWLLGRAPGDRWDDTPAEVA
ncbi:MAG: DUF4272 domain-containing protein [Polyangiaceae bacterium]|nr:DUF4272 domain-containing protein [Polyangiaceae bacterium]